MNLILEFFNNLFSGSKVKSDNPVNAGAPDVVAEPAAVTVEVQGATPGKSHIDLAKWKPEWTTGVLPTIKEHLSTLSKAKDIESIYPGYSKLTEQNKALVWVELFKAMCKFESGFNPLSSSVDVGVAGKRDTYSVGLLQMSVVDQSNLGIKLGYKYDDILDPVKNLILATRVMANQVAKRGLVMIDKDNKGNPGTYWAVIKVRGMFDKSNAIKAYVQYLKFDTAPVDPVDVPPVPTVNDLSWYDIAVAEIGVKEIRGSSDTPRIVEYHSATTLKAKDDETPWCAAFVSWVLLKAGYKTLKTAWARDYATYGIKLDQPKKGCIIVFERNGKGGDSHVTFYTGKDDGRKHLCVGGNQGDKVCIDGYSKSDVIAYRWPVK